MTDIERQECRDKVIKLCGTEPESIVDGPGFRFVVFVQGCSHHCKGCHNPQSHDPAAGRDVSVGEMFDEISKNPYLRGVTLSGGEPFEQVDAMLALGKLVRDAGYDLMSYTGYTYEQLKERQDPATDELLGLLDILVDGPFVEAQRNLTLVYRGSENQRVIDMKKTREAGEVALYKSEFGIEI